MALEQRFQQGAARLQRMRAQVFAIELQQVVREHAHRRVGERLRPGLAALDAGLQRGERQRGIAVAPRQQLAIQHRIAGQRGERGLDLREPAVEAFLAARPQRDVARTADQLQADAVPLPFEQPVPDRAQRIRFAFERRREEERVGRRRIARLRLARGEPLQECRGRGPLAEHALRDQRDVDARCFGQRLLHQPARDTDP